jgi:hypothetical protein
MVERPLNLASLIFRFIPNCSFIFAEAFEIPQFRIDPLNEKYKMNATAKTNNRIARILKRYLFIRK